MISGYKTVSIIYGGNGRKYADALSKKIAEISEEKRYPIQAAIIDKKILTRELLADVMELFKQSEFCVVFLTEEDTCLTENGEKKRLRQNVVFELGMALIELGREHCILMSDFDIRNSNFDLPSDMNSLEIKYFNADDLKITLDDIVDTLLKSSQHSVATNIKSIKSDIAVNYSDLLIRNEYRIDYENIFASRPITLASEGRRFFSDTLAHWLSECESLPHYDEKCIYLLERIGFMPILGDVSAAVQFMEQAEKLIETYSISDIEYYRDDELLIFTKNLIQCIIGYTILKTKKTNESEIIRSYEDILDNFTQCSMPNRVINPLIMIAYYDYIGLTYFRIYRMKKNNIDLDKAKESFLNALKYVSYVDMSMQVWAGFLNYNLARVLSEYEDAEAESAIHYKKAIAIRGKWLKNSNYNITVRSALSYEYFIARIDYIDMALKFRLMSTDDAQEEYNYVERELDIYSEIDTKLDQLLSVRRLLEERKRS